MILMIDNYDSFTYNIVQYLLELGADVVVHRIQAMGPKGQKTIEARVIERNTSKNVTQQAVNT